METASYLIAMGHVNCLDYGFKFFLCSIRSLGKLQKDLIMLQAAAIGVALGGEKVAKEIFKDG